MEARRQREEEHERQHLVVMEAEKKRSQALWAEVQGAYNTGPETLFSLSQGQQHAQGVQLSSEGAEGEQSQEATQVVDGSTSEEEPSMDTTTVATTLQLRNAHQRTGHRGRLGGTSTHPMTTASWIPPRVRPESALRLHSTHPKDECFATKFTEKRPGPRIWRGSRADAVRRRQRWLSSSKWGTGTWDMVLEVSALRGLGTSLSSFS